MMGGSGWSWRIWSFEGDPAGFWTTASFFEEKKGKEIGKFRIHNKGNT